jgi:septum formation protein
LIQADELVITADTIVWLDGTVMGKPKDEEEAKDMLMRLSGKTHQVITGVCLTTASTQKTFATVTDVTFATLMDEEVDYYVTRYQPMDKAGSYGVQEWIGFVGVENLSGSYFNVMGLPIQRLYTELKKL